MSDTIKRAIVLLADGFEDVEAVTPIDYLSRAGIEVTTVSVSPNMTVTSRWGGIKMAASTKIADLKDQNWDAVIIPGGLPGAPNIAASKEANTLIKAMAAAKKLVCAICAAPLVVLNPLGLLAGKRYTCHPGLEEKSTDGIWSNERVVVDGNLITSRGAGTAGEFSIMIIEKLLDERIAKKIAEMVLL